MKKPHCLLPVAAFFGAASYLQAIDVAGELLVDLRASDYASNAAEWLNHGTLSDFTAAGSFKRESVKGSTAVVFDGAEYFSGPVSPGTLGGPDPTWTVEVWAWQGNIRDEESVVAWGHRGGPDGSNASFNYGTNPDWGAMGHWGAPDIGWNGTPEAGNWHHLAYTYDGTTTRVYANGVEKNTETIGLNIHPNDIMRLGAQNNDAGAAEPSWFSGAIGQVRVHSDALSGAQIANNYSQEVGNYSGSAPAPAAGLTRAPVNRYSFDNASGGAPQGTQVTDSVGGAHGVIQGEGANATGSQIDLPGGSPNSAAYIDLPNGLISAHTVISIELWATVDTTANQKNWSRIFDFGSGDAGEIVGVGGAASGNNYITLSGHIGDDNNKRFERVGGVAQNGSVTRDSAGNFLDTERHYVITYDPVEQEWRHYENGLLFDSIATSSGPDSVPDVNNWLGRSQWTGDANLDGKFNELRIYDYALSESEILLNLQLGPDSLRIIPEPTTALLLMAGSSLLGLRRRRS